MTTYPDVPIAPGVPPVPRDPQAPIVDNIIIATSDAVQLLRLFAPPQWGLFFQNGGIALSASSVVAVEVRADAALATAPMEQGAFQDYDKVQQPYLVRMTFAVDGGSWLPTYAGIGLSPSGNRAQFLLAVEALRISTDLLSAVTPDIVYPNVNVVHYDYRRTAVNGATMLSVDVWLEQIRPTGTATFSNTQSLAGADPVNDGTVQPQPLPTGLLSYQTLPSIQ